MRLLLLVIVATCLKSCVNTPNIKETTYDFEKARSDQFTNKLKIYSSDVQLISRVSQNVFSTLSDNSIHLLFLFPDKPPRKLFYNKNNYQFIELYIKYKIEDEIVYGALLALPTGELSSYFSERLILTFYSQNNEKILINSGKFEIDIHTYSELPIFSELSKQLNE